MKPTGMVSVVWLNGWLQHLQRQAETGHDLWRDSRGHMGQPNKAVGNIKNDTLCINKKSMEGGPASPWKAVLRVHGRRSCESMEGGPWK